MTPRSPKIAQLLAKMPKIVLRCRETTAHRKSERKKKKCKIKFGRHVDRGSSPFQPKTSLKNFLKVKKMLKKLEKQGKSGNGV